ncbi:MAG: DNA-directed RNA polymerase subunit omega [Verrucomicrobiales bacterium]|nr:DNA-directed RNA polymerase subunit omega [Verrucomicrobiales bacterium]MCP5526025.1 DNA-directed RNA polymerase subunit omega [Verrucomicrobiales bacterium]
MNLISRRVRQLNSGGGAMSRPLLDNPETLGAADVALREVVEDRITYELLTTPEDWAEEGAPA